MSNIQITRQEPKEAPIAKITAINPGPSKYSLTAFPNSGDSNIVIFRALGACVDGGRSRQVGLRLPDARAFLLGALALVEQQENKQ